MQYYKEDIMDSLPFKKFLEEMLLSIKDLSHVNKSDNTYYKADEAVRAIKNRFVQENKWTWDQYDKAFQTKDISLSAKLLKRYSLKDSDKRKKKIIEEFVSNYSYDLEKVLFNMSFEKPSDPAI